MQVVELFTVVTAPTANTSESKVGRRTLSL